MSEWKNYSVSVKISNSNSPFWIPKIPIKLIDRIRWLFYKKFGVYKENDDTKWFEWKNKKLIIAITFAKQIRDAEDGLKNEISN